MRKIGTTLKIIFIIPFILLSACKEKENVAPTVDLVTPQEVPIPVDLLLFQVAFAMQRGCSTVLNNLQYSGAP
jgi:hypothetical protein